MWLVGKATGSERGHFQAERACLCQLGYSPHNNLFVCVLSGCSETLGHLEWQGESALYAWVTPAALLASSARLRDPG